MTDSNDTINKEEIINKVWSLIHNELKCITVKYISYNYKISRNESYEILKSIPTFKDAPNPKKELQYELIYCISDDSAVKLKRNVISSKDNNNMNKILDKYDGIIYSLCLLQNDGCTSGSNNNVIAAHERDMVYVREHKNTIFTDESIVSTILPNPELSSLSKKYNDNKVNRGNSAKAAQSQQIARPKKEIKKLPATSSSSTQSSSSSIKSNNDKKATTAASFFGISKAKSKKDEKSADKPKTQEDEMNESHEEDEKKSSKTKTKKLKFTKAPKKSSKNNHEKNTQKISKGNVDDFIGDMDEESDNEIMEIKPTSQQQRSKKRSIIDDESEDNNEVMEIDKPTKQQRSKKRSKDETNSQPKKKQKKESIEEIKDSEDDDDDNHLIRYDDEPKGAMDNFVQHNTTSQQKPSNINQHKGKKENISR